MSMQTKGRIGVTLAMAMAVGCAVEEDPRSMVGGGLEPFGMGSGSGGDTDDMDESDGDGDEDGDVDEDDTIFDLPAPGAEPAGDGCAAVDFLFVIDNSISMQDQQNKLKAAFPQFIATIEQTLPTRDYHIMVADTDAWGRCDTVDWNGSNPNHEACNNYIENTSFEQCDRTRGAGVVHPAGRGATNGECNLYGGNRYIIEGQPDVSDAFRCIASVGLAGHPDERALDGIVKAVSSGHTGPDGCNEGFLRDDAILVVTFISDDGQVKDVNTAQQAYDKVVAAKGGNPESVVVLGLVNNSQTHWIDFVQKFGERGIRGTVNEEDYNAFFLDAVSTIEGTCRDLDVG